MWSFLSVIGFLAFLAALACVAVFAVKRNAIWKKWLAGAGVALILFVASAINSAPQPAQPIPPDIQPLAVQQTTTATNAPVSATTSKLHSKQQPRLKQLNLHKLPHQPPHLLTHLLLLPL